MHTDIPIARSDFNNAASIVIPCSVNAYGRFRSPIRSELDITICDFQFANSFSLN